MKDFGVWVLLFLVGADLINLGFSRKDGTKVILGAPVAPHQSEAALTETSGMLKENIHAQGQDSHKRETEGVNVEDYHPIDPVPSSKASIWPEPIQHGTPLMPYIPMPSSPPTPDHSKHGGFP